MQQQKTIEVVLYLTRPCLPHILTSVQFKTGSVSVRILFTHMRCGKYIVRFSAKCFVLRYVLVRGVVYLHAYCEDLIKYSKMLCLISNANWS